MCGFAGFIDARRRAPEERRRILAAMGGQLARRGPDDERIEDDGVLAFVFRRLSIVDLETGAQPIYNARRTRFVAVNGEIYNHLELRDALSESRPFATRSDAEIVLHLYEERGPAALEALIGKFAIALWDGPARRLFLARDRLGIKPLYYCTADGLILFGSELKALLAHPDCPRRMDFADVRDEPVLGGLRTFIEGIRQLPGGTHLTWEDDRLRVGTYWSIDRLAPTPDPEARPFEAYAEAYAELLSDSVRRRLMSDVPLGGFLSGGLDSALVMAIASRTRRGLPAFFALERTTHASGDADAARRAADLLGLDLRAVLFDGAGVASAVGFDLATLEYFVWLLDSPRFELEWFYKHELHRYAKAVIPGLKVILLGQGADELAGGYSNAWTGASSSWAEYLQVAGAAARREAIDRAGVAPWMAPLLGEQSARFFGSSFAYEDEIARRAVVLQNHNLWHEDRTAAAQGIEARVPFLDHRLVELCATLPRSLRAQAFFDKRLVRVAARRYLPDDLAGRRKVGFYHVHDTSSVDALGAEIVRRVFPQFDEAYLACAGALFARAPVQALARVAEGSGSAGRTARARLFAVMAAAIFDRLCREIPRGWLPVGHGPPSPLSAIARAPERWGAPIDRAEPDWSEDLTVTLERDVEIARVLGDGAPELRVLRGGACEEELVLGADLLWMEKLLAALSARRPLCTSELVGQCGLPADELPDALAFLWHRRWIEFGSPRSLARPAGA